MRKNNDKQDKVQTSHDDYISKIEKYFDIYSRKIDILILAICRSIIRIISAFIIVAKWNWKKKKTKDNVGETPFNHVTNVGVA